MRFLILFSFIILSWSFASAQSDSLKQFIESQESLESIIHKKLDSALVKIERKLSENDSIHRIFKGLRIQCDSLLTEIDQLKVDLIKTTDNSASHLNDIKNPENLDAPKSVMIDNHNGIELKKKLNKFNDNIIHVLTLLEENTQIDLIGLEDVHEDNELVTWEKAMFENSTLTAAHTVLSTIQIDIKNILLQTGRLLYKL